MATAIAIGYWLMDKRWKARGLDPKIPSDVAVVVVVSGIVGARVYHLITDWDVYQGRWIDAFKIWEGGLGIWGAVIAGGIAMAVMARIKHFPLWVMGDCVAPALALGQAMGRWGNYFNQELYGRTTTLPWGLKIDASKRVEGYTDPNLLFHPTFLYESLWMLCIFAVLLLVERRFRLRSGQLFWLYVALYTLGRFFWENLRIDPAHEFGPLRVNAWASIGWFSISVAMFVWFGKRSKTSKVST